MKYLPVLLLFAMCGCDQQPTAVPLRAETAPAPMLWADFSNGEVSFETPITLLRLTELGADDRVSATDAFEGTTRDSALTVATLHQVTHPGITIDLDLATEGAIRGVATREGDNNAKISVSSTEISGVDARRVVCESSLPDKPFWVDGVVISLGQELWAVLVVRRKDRQQLLTDRVLNSVRTSEKLTFAAKVSPKAVPQGVYGDLPPYDPNFVHVEEWIKKNDPGPLTGRQHWWPVVDQNALYAELKPRYTKWRETHPGEQTPPDEFEELYNHEQQHPTDAAEEQIQFPQKLLRLRYLIEIDGRTQMRDRVFVLHDGLTRRIDEADIVFSKAYGILQSFRLDMIAPD